MSPLKELVRFQKILLVEDDKDFAELISSEVSGRMGCPVETAENSFKALNLIYENEYDAILLDWNLPEMTGQKTLKEAEISFLLDPSLQGGKHSTQVPVILISSDQKLKFKDGGNKFFKYIGFVSKMQPHSKITAQICRRLDQYRARTRAAENPQLRN